MDFWQIEFAELNEKELEMLFAWQQIILRT